jgi:hypothetical protein
MPAPLVTTEILLLSDVHVGDLAQTARLRGEPAAGVRDNVERAAADMVAAIKATELRPTVLLVAGDLTSRGSPWEFQVGNLFLEAAKRQLGIDPNGLLLAGDCTPGAAQNTGRPDHGPKVSAMEARNRQLAQGPLTSWQPLARTAPAFGSPHGHQPEYRALPREPSILRSRLEEA